MWKEFREFIARGSVIELAVGIVIGAAFGKIVESLVKDIIMPPIGLALGKVDFSNLYIALNGPHYATLAEAQKAGAPTINYGLFLNNIISFVIVAFAVFVLIRQVNRMRRRNDVPADPTEKMCPRCVMSIPIQATRCPHCTSDLVAVAR